MSWSCNTIQEVVLAPVFCLWSWGVGMDNVLLIVPRVNFTNSIKKRKEIIVLLNVVFLAACPASSIFLDK